jgi:predicted neutral ceramidase superfamily lipid hydrolase
MIELLYQLLNQVGFTHPLHPAVTHLPMGMSMGAFIFGVAALKYEALARTARHCAVVGLIFIPPTMIAGILDWQHFYDGDWSSHIIIKFILAFVLFFLLLGSLKASSGEGQPSRLSIVIYALCLLTAIGLGFTAGEIQYG